MQLKNSGARLWASSASGTSLTNLLIQLIRLRTHGSSSARLSAPHPCQCSLEQPFSSPAEVDITKGQTPSGARSERLKGFVCLPVPCLSHRSPQFVISNLTWLWLESQCPEGGVKCAKARPQSAPELRARHRTSPQASLILFNFVSLTQCMIPIELRLTRGRLSCARSLRLCPMLRSDAASKAQTACCLDLS